MPDTNTNIEKIAGDFLELMPLFRNNLFKPLEKVTSSTLSPMQCHVLIHLDRKGSPLTMSELASEMGILKQQLTTLTDKLAENKYVERVHDEKDRRTVKISITKRGQDFLEECKRLGAEVITNKLATLPLEDINELHSAVKTINRIVSKLS